MKGRYGNSMMIENPTENYEDRKGEGSDFKGFPQIHAYIHLSQEC